jgi:two-component system, OmpR family, sensor histidine kinase SenX3
VEVVLIAIATGAIVLVIAGAIARARARHRLVYLAAALNEAAPPEASPGELLSLVERSAARIRRHDADVARQHRRFALALGAMTQGAVLADETGTQVMHNGDARSFVEARHGEALVRATIDEMLHGACRGESDAREVEIFGPPHRLLRVTAKPLNDGDEILGAIATVDDISDQQRIDAIRRDFVANISHELRTPIGAVALLAETMVDETDPAVIRRLSIRLRDESFRVSQMIDDLLALTQIEGDGLKELETLRVSHVVADAADRIRPAAEHARVSIEIAAQPHELLLRGDRRQLVSAVFNLLENAVKYSDPDSVVEVRTAGDAASVSIVVQDHGIGIPTKDLDRIFERFYRVDQARSRQTGGTGLGLSIVRHVARNHGGAITVSSREGEGSTFMLVLPVGDVATPAVPGR